VKTKTIEARAGAVVTVEAGQICIAHAGSIVMVNDGVCDAREGSVVTINNGMCAARKGSIVTVYGGVCLEFVGSNVTDRRPGAAAEDPEKGQA